MRISDWSSDVCSSDLDRRICRKIETAVIGDIGIREQGNIGDAVGGSGEPVTAGEVLLHHRQRLLAALQAARQLARAPRRIHRRPAADSSEERRGGKEGVGTSRSRW